MIERYFPQANVLLRLRSGPIGPYLPRFVSALEQRQFSRDTICRYIRVADGLCRWLDDQGVGLVEGNKATSNSTCSTTLDCRTSVISRGACPNEVKRATHRDD